MTERKVFFGRWADANDMWADWSDTRYAAIPETFPPQTEGEILFAWYGDGSYCGAAVVIGRKPDGSLYEVHGSHCSCYGLEGQWETEPATIESLEKTIPYGLEGDYYDDSAEALIAFHELIAQLKAAA